MRRIDTSAVVAAAGAAFQNGFAVARPMPGPAVLRVCQLNVHPVHPFGHPVFDPVPGDPSLVERVKHGQEADAKVAIRQRTHAVKLPVLRGIVLIGCDDDLARGPVFEIIAFGHADDAHVRPAPQVRRRSGGFLHPNRRPGGYPSPAE